MPTKPKAKTTTPTRRHPANTDNDLEAANTARDTAMKKWRGLERTNRSLRRQLDMKDTEIQLRETAMRAGVQDVDYAIRLMTRSLKGKTEAEIAEFNEEEYFTKLKTSKPYLFNEVHVPANTGNGNVETPPAPKADEVQQAVAGNSGFDAMKATKKEIDDRLNALGVDPNIAAF